MSLHIFKELITKREKNMAETATRKNAIVVLAACVLVNLAIQILYVWSLIRVELTNPEGYFQEAFWTSGQAALPFTLILVFFATGALIGGRLQDKFGPRWVAASGGLLVGTGLILSGVVSESPVGVALTFGVLTGIGIGFGYGSVLPAAQKWFHTTKRGLIAGIVLGGFALASVIYAPITEWLLRTVGISWTFIYLGIGVAIVAFIAAQFVKNPPEGYQPEEPKNIEGAAENKKLIDFDYKEMLKTRVFYLMFATFALVSSIGLMMIGNASNITNFIIGRYELEAPLIMGMAIGAFLVSFIAVINTAGRIAGGSLADRIGRINTLLIATALQMANMLLFAYVYKSIVFIIIGFALVGLCFGVFLTMFPAITGDQYGLKNYGFNYGIMYMAYGAGALLAPAVAPLLSGNRYLPDGTLNDAYSYTNVYLACAALMIVALGLIMWLNAELKKRNVMLDEMREAKEAPVG